MTVAPRSGRVLGAIVVTLSVIGCSMMDLGGLAGGELADGGETVAPGASQGGAGDASADGSSARFCAGLSPKPTMCIDFDDEPPFGGWRLDTEDGNIEASPLLARSAPRSGLFARPVDTGSVARVSAQYAIATSSAPSEIVIAGDVRVERRDDSNEIDIFTAILPYGANSYEVQLSMVEGKVQIEEWRYQSDGENPHNVVLMPALIPLGAWLHVEFTVALQAGSASVAIDGAAAGSVSLSTPAGLGPPTIELGDGYLRGGPFAMHLDNVTANLK